MTRNFFIQLLIWFAISTFSHAGEPGTEMPVQTKEEPAQEKIETVKEKKEPQNLVNTKITFPKNPLNSLFYQSLGQEINKKYARIIADCVPIYEEGFCKKVKPKKKSVHFNQYYYYLNQAKEVHAIVAFSNKRVGATRDCRAMLKEWKEYFSHFDLQKTSNANNIDLTNKEVASTGNLDQLMLIDESINKVEVNMSCYPENFRDIKSYFRLSVLVDEK